jgi:hypothetical protein
MTSHRVLVGINYPPHGKGDEVRAEVGDVIDDIPPKVAKLWTEQGIIEHVGTKQVPDGV